MERPMKTLALAWVLAVACDSEPVSVGPQLSVTDVVLDPKSCLPVVPFPNRPPFDVLLRPSADPGEVRLRIQQLPDAGNPPGFAAALEGKTIRLEHKLGAVVEGSGSCDVDLRVTGMPAGTYSLEVWRWYGQNRLSLGTRGGITVR